MLAKCFLHDTWSHIHYDADPQVVSLVFDSDFNVVEVTGQRYLFAKLFPMGDRTEELAEKILAHAACLNKAHSEDEARKRYADRGDLDLGEGRIIEIQGKKLMVPDPEYLGHFCTDDKGNANFTVHNVRAVLPIV